MGEPEQVIAEPDEQELEGLHPPTLEQKNPTLVTSLVTKVLSFLIGYGWYVVGFMLVGFIAWNHLEPKIKRWLKKREDDQEAAEYHKNPDILLSRHQALDAARQKMQEQYNKVASDSLEKRKVREEKMREDKIAEWERMQSGKGNRLKDKSSASVSDTKKTNSSSAKDKPAAKPRMRPEYNPLTGDAGASSCRWRPTSRGASGGG
ncbi:selenoprotein S A-like [Portunus trituberculatus]|uniref:selenoprotein S A-like n=1 Tax=Portunus trituberculatus TaxID=210409 RepID=UPI001E1CB510|nr:selenoprotein S A-like [Portunus trituberculatus]